MNKTLRDFLIKERVFKKFVRNCRANKMDDTKIKDFLKAERGYAIDSAFIFQDTPEGSQFWFKLCDKHIEFVE